MGCGTRMPKPSAHIILPNVCKATVHSAGLSPCHRQRYGQKPTEAIVRKIGKVSAETSVKNGRQKSRRSTSVEIGMMYPPPKK